MEITEAQYRRMEACLPPSAWQRKYDEPGGIECHSVCGRAWVQVARVAEAFRKVAHRLYPHDRWSKNGVLDRVFEPLQREQIVHTRIEVVKPDSTLLKAHPDRTGALRKTGAQEVGKPRGRWTSWIHLGAANARTVTFARFVSRVPIRAEELTADSAVRCGRYGNQPYRPSGLAPRSVPRAVDP
jgi:hypothetical protein